MADVASFLHRREMPYDKHIYTPTEQSGRVTENREGSQLARPNQKSTSVLENQDLSDTGII